MIYIIGEQFQGKIMPVTMELMGEGCRLAAEMKEETIVVLLGDSMEEEAQKLLKYPVDAVVCLEHPCLHSYCVEMYQKALTEFYRESHRIKKSYQNKESNRNGEADVILIGATSYGREYAPALAAQLHTGVVTDCQSLYPDRDTGRILAVRPAFDGKQMSVYQIPDANPQIFTFRPGVLGKPQPIKEPTSMGEQKPTEEKLRRLRTLVPNLTEIQAGPRILQYLPKEEKEINLAEANIIVAGGRGMKGTEGFESLEQLANALGGEVASTRPCVDAGWTTPAQQIGQTGLTVHPDLYLAFGISGAIQHITGFADSKYIIGINNNPNAVLFRYCDYGIVGDAHKIAKELTGLLTAQER